MARLQATGSRLLASARTALAVLGREAALMVDRERLSAAATWRDRLNAVSWRRVAVAGGGVATVALATGLGLWLMQPEFRGSAPRLPTEQEWRANQEAVQAMDAPLSPALAEANKAVPN